jgi:hypothetical protein
MQGALIHIAQSPYRVADYNAEHPTVGRSERACAVLDLLGGDNESRKQWAAIARASSDVKTVLSKLGRPTTAALLEHAYVLAMCNLHILLDNPLLNLPPRERLETLATPRTLPRRP